MPYLQPVHRIDADIAIIGTGFSGSLTALALRHRHLRVVLVERDRHPRFAIGESSTPLANLLLEELADRYDLPRLKSFSKWGTWQRSHPDVAVGLKRGFSFFFHRLDDRFCDDRTHARQLLVAASPHDEIGDTHWYRPDFDHWLVREAEAEGAVYLDETVLDNIRDDHAQIVLDGTRLGRAVRISARFLIDASGPRGFLHRALGLAAPPLRWLPSTSGLYTHFHGVDRLSDVVPRDEAPPYPVDDAAVHHVFDDGWIWVLRFNNGVTSAGVACTGGVWKAIASQEDAGAAWKQLLTRLPTVREQFERAGEVRPFVRAPRLAFRVRQTFGSRWALLPSAIGVIDPLLSTGFPLTLLGVQRLVDVLERTGDGSERQSALASYERISEAELDATERLIAALYASMRDPEMFKRLTLLYFAAASYAEAARRLGRPDLAPGFLLHAHPRFGSELRECCESALAPMDDRARQALCARIDRAIEPFDIAGLRDRSRRDWYPVLADDLLNSRAKLNASADDMRRLLERSGFAGPPDQEPQSSQRSQSRCRS